MKPANIFVHLHHIFFIHFNSYFPGKLGLASSPRFHHPVAQEDTFDDYITTL